MKLSIRFLLFLVLSTTLILTPGSSPELEADRAEENGDWKIQEARFDGQENALFWSARISEFPAGQDFLVTRAYNQATLKPFKPAAGEKRVASAELRLSQRGVLTLWKNKVDSRLADHLDPQNKIRYTFRLELGKQLLITWPHTITLEESDVSNISDAANDSKASEESDKRLSRLLGNDARRLLLALREGDSSRIDQSSIVRLAVWILTTPRPLGDNIRKVYLESMGIIVNKRLIKVDVSKNRELRISARLKDEITLLPVYGVREYTAYGTQVATRERPLPEYAFIKLSQTRNKKTFYGAATDKAGEFRLGPVKLGNLRRMNLLAAYPLEPPGEKPHLMSRLLFRSGRRVEVYLDRGMMPPAPPLPGNFSMNDVVSRVVQTARRSINPDFGEIQGLSDEHLVNLYAIGYKRILRHPELVDVLDTALIEEVSRKSWTYPRRELSWERGWTEKDARTVLEYPGLARDLAVKLKTELEPRGVMTAKTGNNAEFRQADKKSAAPHALAAAALTRALLKYTEKKSRARARKLYDPIVIAQLKHLAKKHRPGSSYRQSLADLTRTGQALKYVAAHSPDARARSRAGRMVRQIRQNAYGRFRSQNRRMSLQDKVEIAHLISPVWRPFLNTPEQIKIGGRPGDLEPIAPDDKNRVKDRVFDEARRRYRSALKRGVEELKTQPLSESEKELRLEQLIRRWHTYLFRINNSAEKLTDYKKLLEEDGLEAQKDLASTN